MSLATHSQDGDLFVTNAFWFREPVKEFGRTLRLDQEAERKLLAAADSLLERGAWTRKMHDTFREVVVFVRDTGMRNKKELFCARIEDIDWNNRVFLYPTARLTMAGGLCHSVIALWSFREARCEGGLPEKLALYCGRHDFGTRVLQGTGNLAVVMRAIGHGSPSTAMKYQHPELEQVRRVLNGTNGSHNLEQGL